MEWVEKASFNRLNRLFEIAADERSWQTLFSEQNLRSVTREPQSYVLNILSRRLPKKVVAGEHFVLKDLTFYTEAREADAQARQALLNQREEKRQEGTLRRAPGDKRLLPFPPSHAPVGKKKKVPTKGIVIRSPAPSDLPAPSSDSSECRTGPNGSRPSMPAYVRLALLVKEEALVDQLGILHPDANATGAPCLNPMPLAAPSM